MSEQRSGRQTIADISELKVKPTGSSTLVKVADHLSGWVNVRSYGAKGDGVTDDYAALSAMVTALGSTNATLIVPGPCLVGTNLTIPSNLLVRFEGAGAFTGAGTVTFKRWTEQGSPPDWDTAEFPVIIGHRGSGNIAAPENTLAAFDYAAGLGVAVETDVQSTVDGALVLMHDLTVDRTTGTTGGDVKSLLSDQMLVLDAAQGYRPDLFSPQRIPLFTQYLERYGKTHLLAPEIKAETGTTGTDAAQMIVRYGLQRSVLGYSFWQAMLSQIAAVDPSIKRMRVSTDLIDAATAASEGLWGVAISQVNLTQEYVTTMKAAGFKVFAWTVNTIAAGERLTSWGVDGLVTDDPAYLRAFIDRRTLTGTTTINVPPTLAGAGWRATTQTTGAKTIAAGFVTFGGYGAVADANNSLLYVPLRPADSPGTQTITTTLKVVAGPTSGATTRFLGLRFCWTTDDEFTYIGTSATNGYYVALRLNGTVEIARVTAGVASVLGSSTWTALSVGQAVPLRVDITPTTITVTRTDNSETYSRTDATHVRGGFISAFGSGVVPGIGQTVVTY
jgi:glycerophosphoryl diester phosphodiesterase